MDIRDCFDGFLTRLILRSQRLSAPISVMILRQEMRSRLTRSKLSNVPSALKRGQIGPYPGERLSLSECFRSRGQRLGEQVGGQMRGQRGESLGAGVVAGDGGGGGQGLGQQVGGQVRGQPGQRLGRGSSRR